MHPLRTIRTGSELPPHLTKDSDTLIITGITGLAHHYERSLRRIALEKDPDGNPTRGAEMAYTALLGITV